MPDVATNAERKTITREHLSRAIKRETGINANSASMMVDTIILLMIQAITENKDVRIRLFGSFRNCSKKARVGRNPKTMVNTLIPERKVVRFKVAPSLKRRINNSVNYIAPDEMEAD